LYATTNNGIKKRSLSVIIVFTRITTRTPTSLCFGWKERRAPPQTASSRTRARSSAPEPPVRSAKNPGLGTPIRRRRAPRAQLFAEYGAGFVIDLQPFDRWPVETSTLHPESKEYPNSPRKNRLIIYKFNLLTIYSFGLIFFLFLLENV